MAVGWGVGLRSLLRGLIKALLLLLFVVGVLLLSGQARWSGGLTPAEIVNAVLLILGVGFAEELVFRGWLWGELNQRLGWGPRADQRALIAQAAVFSLAHTRFNLGVGPMAGLLVGLLLLGLALGLQRRADGGSLWGAVGLHGGLVGGWFSLLAGPLQINPDGAALAGRARRCRSQSDRRPAGLGRPGRAALGAAALLVNRAESARSAHNQRTAVARALRPSTGACSASSRGARP